MEVTYKSGYPAFLGHIPVSMIVLVVEVSSAIVLMFLQGSVEGSHVAQSRLCVWS